MIADKNFGTDSTSTDPMTVKVTVHDSTFSVSVKRPSEGTAVHSIGNEPAPVKLNRAMRRKMAKLARRK